MKYTHKKFLTIEVVLLFFFHTYSFAQGDAYQKGNSIITLGYGFPNLSVGNLTRGDSYPDGLYFYDQDYSTTSSGFGPIHLKYEYAVSRHWGIGISIAYATYNIQGNIVVPDTVLNWEGQTYYGNSYTTYTNDYKGSSIDFLAHFNYHFLISNKFEAYLGAGVGYNYWSYRHLTNDPNEQADLVYFPTLNPSNIAYELTLGARYYFSPNISVYAEVGLNDKSIFQIGLSTKFGY